MTREILEEYYDVVAEIERIDKKIANCSKTVYTDTVSGSSSEYPYTKHPITIRGVGMTQINDLIAERHEWEFRRKTIKSEIDRFIRTIPNSRQRRIVSMRMEGMTFKEIAAEMNKGHHGYKKFTEDSVKKTFYRTIQNNVPNVPNVPNQ